MYDVVIVGGAVVGSSAAYHLLARAPGLKLAVVERDPSYELAATGRSFGGVRVLFSQEENILMSQYGHAFYADFPAAMAVAGEAAALDFTRQGYLFMALEAEEARNLELNHELQRRLGCRVDLIDAAELKRRFPSLRTDDVLLAAHAPDDGWIDPHGALMGLRRKARTLGADYLDDEVVGIELAGGRVSAAVMKRRGAVATEWLLNCAGAWAPEICAMLAMPVPVVPLSRSNFHFECREQLEPLPLFRDVPGIGGRPEGRGYICGYTDFDNAGRFDFEPRHEVFERHLWPGLAHRVPAFEAVKVGRAWAGHYAHNHFDGNLIVGGWPGGVGNFLIATGFSGHGLQHAPAVGRALAELVLDGGFRSIDLDRFTYRRVQEDTPYPERGMKA